MTHVDWEIHGLYFGNCNCDYSCPCQFEANPTHGDCRGTGFFRIDKGHFGEVSLDGLKMGASYDWPGPIHEAMESAKSSSTRTPMRTSARRSASCPWAKRPNRFQTSLRSILPRAPSFMTPSILPSSSRWIWRNAPRVASLRVCAK